MLSITTGKPIHGHNDQGHLIQTLIKSEGELFRIAFNIYNFQTWTSFKLYLTHFPDELLPID